jgi:hypothetical protein
MKRFGLSVFAFILCAVTWLDAGTALAGSAWQHADRFRNGVIGPVPSISLGKLARIRPMYDVIVAGTDPEGIAAAVSAARNGLKVLLVDAYERRMLGGLMTLGWLNSLDMNRYKPGNSILNQGIFTEWYDQVEGDSFDVGTAEAAFGKMVYAERNIDVLMPVASMKPYVELVQGTPTITGLTLALDSGIQRTIQAKAVIDATQDADIAAAAGVPYTFGREDIGSKDALMAVTLVFRLEGVTADVWRSIRVRLRGDREYGSTNMSAWGYKEMYNYIPNHPQVKMRGLNIGRQNDQSMLINALLVYQVDPLDPVSKRSGMLTALSELPSIISHMRRTFPEFSTLRFGGHAPELYVRESRHIQGEYRLNMVDLMENKDKWDRIAFGSYPVDLQSIRPDDNGIILLVPTKYAIPFRSIVPKVVDGLLVVGRSASFDSLPHGSARTIPVGMATGQAAGIAVKIAIERNMTFRAMSRDEVAIFTLQNRLNAQGAVIKPFELEPQPYMLHRTYEGMKVALSLGMITGRYDNNFRLDDKANPHDFGSLISKSKSYFKTQLQGHPKVDPTEMTKNLSLNDAAYTIASALALPVTIEEAKTVLEQNGYLRSTTSSEIKNPDALTVGESYLLYRDFAFALGYRLPATE